MCFHALPFRAFRTASRLSSTRFRHGTESSEFWRSGDRFCGAHRDPQGRQVAVRLAIIPPAEPLHVGCAQPPSSGHPVSLAERPVPVLQGCAQRSVSRARKGEAPLTHRQPLLQRPLGAELLDHRFSVLGVGGLFDPVVHGGFSSDTLLNLLGLGGGGKDSNLRPPDYETGALPLRHPGIRLGHPVVTTDHRPPRVLAIPSDIAQSEPPPASGARKEPWTASSYRDKRSPPAGDVPSTNVPLSGLHGARQS